MINDDPATSGKNQTANCNYLKYDCVKICTHEEWSVLLFLSVRTLAAYFQFEPGLNHASGKKMYLFSLFSMATR